jgi:hypothetical protein
MVIGCSHHLSTAGNSGTAAIWPQRNRAEALLVSGATGVTPPVAFLGPPFAKTSGPSFQGAYRTGRRNVKSIVPDISKVSNFVQILYSN